MLQLKLCYLRFMNYIKIARNEMGLSQHALAEMLGISRAQISLAELDQRELPHKVVIKLSKLKNGMDGLPIDSSAIDLEIPETMQEKYRLDLMKKISRDEIVLKRVEKKWNALAQKHAVVNSVMQMILKEKKKFEGAPLYESRLNEKLQWQKKVWLATHPIVQDEIKCQMNILRAKLKVYGEELEKMDRNKV